MIRLVAMTLMFNVIFSSVDTPNFQAIDLSEHLSAKFIT